MKLARPDRCEGAVASHYHREGGRRRQDDVAISPDPVALLRPAGGRALTPTPGRSKVTSPQAASADAKAAGVAIGSCSWSLRSGLLKSRPSDVTPRPTTGVCPRWMTENRRRSRAGGAVGGASVCRATYRWHGATASHNERRCLIGPAHHQGSKIRRHVSSRLTPSCWSGPSRWSLLHAPRSRCETRARTW